LSFRRKDDFFGFVSIKYTSFTTLAKRGFGKRDGDTGRGKRDKESLQ
jgi:hypothetical protein